jgi:hypothetical protein
VADFCTLEEDIDDCAGTYNLKDSGILTDNPGFSTMVRLPPSRFLRLIANKKEPSPEELKGLGVSFRSAEGLEKSMCNEEPIDPMFLEYDNDQQKITGHEGRQRAKIAQLTGVSSIPVKLFCESRNEEGRLRKDTCDVTSGIDLVRKAEPQSDVTEERFQERAEEFKEECNE